MPFCDVVSSIRRGVLLARMLFLGGVCAHAADAQQDRVSVQSGTTNTLHAVSFPDTPTVFAVGDGEVILRNNDGGATWTTLSSGTSASLRGISLSGDFGIAVW
ncbi:MAG: hypothetical protein KGJ59_03585 [Bacteroidota bacterium]|nr:hypothetical protein [Bacteroidota bacterium]